MHKSVQTDLNPLAARAGESVLRILTLSSLTTILSWCATVQSSPWNGEWESGKFGTSQNSANNCSYLRAVYQNLVLNSTTKDGEFIGIWLQSATVTPYAANCKIVDARSPLIASQIKKWTIAAKPRSQGSGLSVEARDGTCSGDFCDSGNPALSMRSGAANFTTSLVQSGRSIVDAPFESVRDDDSRFEPKAVYEASRAAVNRFAQRFLQDAIQGRLEAAQSALATPTAQQSQGGSGLDGIKLLTTLGIEEVTNVDTIFDAHLTYKERPSVNNGAVVIERVLGQHGKSGIITLVLTGDGERYSVWSFFVP